MNKLRTRKTSLLILKCNVAMYREWTYRTREMSYSFYVLHKVYIYSIVEATGDKRKDLPVRLEHCHHCPLRYLSHDLRVRLLNWLESVQAGPEVGSQLADAIAVVGDGAGDASCEDSPWVIVRWDVGSTDWCMLVGFLRKSLESFG